MANLATETRAARGTGTYVMLACAIVALYLLHQDFWFWRTPYPLVFGFIPIGLAYHGAYCLASAALMWALTSLAWPHHLEDEGPRS